MVRALHRYGQPHAAGEAVSMLIGRTTLDGPARHAIGRLLVELGDARGLELCLSAAADEGCPTYLRVQAAETLLDTPSHEPAVDALLRIARDPLDRDWCSIDLAKILVRLGYLRDAVDQLCREVTDAVTGPDESYGSTRRTDAIEALDIIAPSEHRLLLLHLVDSGAVAARARLDVAESVDRLGETDRPLALARQFVAVHAPATTSPPDGDSPDRPARGFPPNARAGRPTAAPAGREPSRV